jgi:hypothetical protein
MPGIMMNLPPSLEGAKLRLTAEIEQNCKVVYRRIGENHMFAGLWNPNVAEYPDDCLIVPVTSTYAGLSDEFNAATIFANIIGSDQDEKAKFNGSTENWIELLRLTVGVVGR